MSDSGYELSFSLNTLNHLSEGLYSNILRFYLKLVANAWDADATEVSINIRQDEIVIQDNGIGMSIEDANTKFLRIGHQKREDSANTISGRHVMGRKGIGILAIFGIANIAEVYSCKDGVPHGFIIHKGDIERGISSDVTLYRPSSVPQEALSIESGTKIILREIKSSIGNAEKTLRTDLARRFTIINNNCNFSVIINNTPINDNDRDYLNKVQFLWYLGGESSKYANFFTKLKKSFEITNLGDGMSGMTVKGWIGTVYRPSDIPNEQPYHIYFAHGKMIQEDILIDITDAGLYRQYIIGEIEADFMDSDDEDDIITSNRQRIKQTDPRYLKLLEYVKIDIMRVIASTWTKLRKEYPSNPKKEEVNDSSLSKDSNSSEKENTNASSDSSTATENASSDSSTATENASSETNDGEVEDNSFFDDDIPEPSPPPKQEITTAFREMKNLVKNSNIPNQMKNIILYDIQQAAYAYKGTSFKACIVMLGAILEGVMLGTIQRTDVLEYLIALPQVPKPLSDLGPRNPKFADRTVLAQYIGTTFSFQDCKEIIELCVQGTNKLGVDILQTVRNSIHPGSVLKDMKQLARFNHQSAVGYIAKLHEIINLVILWNPPSIP
uniref:Putative type II restriction enzyme HgiDII n=1 Tax=Herpetosiphon aurantiacus TaxID=65 RepID=T2D2_HERAU|nr:RecName: Full=Putative type II restriction enzyme HgiDII; Short=R.HgiDII; AltName: Full=Endonuclease HgiDII; AltName: Full=ORF68 [Herpetosiphon aurantiacus]CAA38942.1 orf 68 [Herpetosiphon giganteus]